jgi:hypothetical protein
LTREICMESDSEDNTFLRNLESDPRYPIQATL